MVLLFADFSENVLDDIPMVDDPAVVVLEDIDERLPPGTRSENGMHVQDDVVAIG